MGALKELFSEVYSADGAIGDYLLSSANFSFETDKHPHQPAGTEKGGQFAPKGQSTVTKDNEGKGTQLTPKTPQFNRIASYLADKGKSVPKRIRSAAKFLTQAYKEGGFPEVARASVVNVGHKAAERWQWAREKYGAPTATIMAGTYLGVYVAYSLNPELALIPFPIPTAAAIGVGETIRRLGKLVKRKQAAFADDTPDMELIVNLVKILHAELCEELGEECREIPEDDIRRAAESFVK
jgi:hypothetical protein